MGFQCVSSDTWVMCQTWHKLWKFGFLKFGSSDFNFKFLNFTFQTLKFELSKHTCVVGAAQFCYAHGKVVKDTHGSVFFLKTHSGCKACLPLSKLTLIGFDMGTECHSEYTCPSVGLFVSFFFLFFSFFSLSVSVSVSFSACGWCVCVCVLVFLRVHVSMKENSGMGGGRVVATKET